MSQCPWYEIDSFASQYDASSFATYLSRQVADGDAEPIDTIGPERHYRSTRTGEVWRLEAPDTHTRGSWRPVD